MAYFEDVEGLIELRNILEITDEAKREKALNKFISDEEQSFIEWDICPFCGGEIERRMVRQGKSNAPMSECYEDEYESYCECCDIVFD